MANKSQKTSSNERRSMQKRIRSLAIALWPKADREAWEQACIPARRLKAGGAAARMKPITQQSHARVYGYLLEFCNRKGFLDARAEPAGHVTTQIIDAFLEELNERVSSVTRMIYIQRIRRVAEILAQTRDFRWLREIESDLNFAARPRAKHHRIVPSDRLLALGIELIERGEASTSLTNLARARLVRDGLMVALLALCPIRLSNFARLRLDHQIQQIDSSWWIILKGAETKSGKPDERPVRAILTPHIERWLEHWRPLFLDPQDAFWPSIKGGPLSYTFVGTIISETTQRALGVAISPHLFRDCAVHTVATRAGDEMGIASSLLQHTDPRTTEKHYNKGASINATRRYQEIINEFEDDPQ